MAQQPMAMAQQRMAQQPMAMAHDKAHEPRTRPWLMTQPRVRTIAQPVAMAHNPRAVVHKPRAMPSPMQL